MAPDPRDCSTPERGRMPNICQNGSACWRTTRRLNTLTTAGAARFTTGAKDMRMAAALSGRRRSGRAKPPCTPWALDLPGWPHAASTPRATAGIRTRRRRMRRAALVAEGRKLASALRPKQGVVSPAQACAGRGSPGPRRSAGPGWPAGTARQAPPARRQRRAPGCRLRRTARAR